MTSQYPPPRLKELAKAIGTRVANRRGAISQLELGRRVGVCASYMSHIEAGRRIPSIPMLLQIAEAIGVDAWELLP